MRARSLRWLTNHAPCRAQCQLLREVAPPGCRADHHTLTPRAATKRFFKCTACGQRTDTLSLYPAEACARCGGRDYARSGLRDVRRPLTPRTQHGRPRVSHCQLHTQDAKGPNLHTLLLRGEEQPFAL
jgi:hypothetical protein